MAELGVLLAKVQRLWLVACVLFSTKVNHQQFQSLRVLDFVSCGVIVYFRSSTIQQQYEYYDAHHQQLLLNCFVRHTDGAPVYCWPTALDHEYTWQVFPYTLFEYWGCLSFVFARSYASRHVRM